MSEIATPEAASAEVGHATLLFESVKHGSWIALPTMHRYASARCDAIELVQQYPVCRDVTRMDFASKTTTFVWAAMVGTARAGAVRRPIAVARAAAIFNMEKDVRAHEANSSPCGLLLRRPKLGA